MPSKLPDFIAEAMRAKGLEASFRSLARASGREDDPMMILRVATGRSNKTLETYQKLCTVLGITLQEFGSVHLNSSRHRAQLYMQKRLESSQLGTVRRLEIAAGLGRDTAVPYFTAKANLSSLRNFSDVCTGCGITLDALADNLLISKSDAPLLRKSATLVSGTAESLGSTLGQSDSRAKVA